MPDRATIVAGALDALGPDPEAAAAFWRALPKDAPPTALDAALRCVAAGRPVYPVWLIWDAAAGKFSKPAAVDAYYHVAASPDEHGVNDKGRPARFSTLDPDTCRAWWGPGGPFARCGVGVVLAPDAFGLDADDDDAAAWLAGAVVNSADTWIIHGGRGARAVYRRPAWVADVKPDGWRYSVRRRKEDGPDVAGGCDVVGGVLVVWTPGAKRRSWTGGPERIADPTPALDAVLHAALDPLPRPAAPVPSGPVAVPDGRRGMRYVGTALERLWRDLATLTEGKQNALWKASKAAGRALARADRPDLATWAEDQLASAAPWANTRHERDTIRRGIAAGLRQAAPGLEDRPLQGRTAAAPATGPDADAIRARACIALADLPARLVELTPEHFTTCKVRDDGTVITRILRQRRESVGLIATRAWQAVIESGRPWVDDDTDTLGIDSGRSGSTVRTCKAALAALGIERVPPDAGRRGGWCVSLGEFLATFARDPLGAGGGSSATALHPSGVRADFARNSGGGADFSDTLANLAWATSNVVRGARSRRAAPEPPIVTVKRYTDAGPVESEAFLALGPFAHRFARAVEELTGAEGPGAGIGVLVDRLDDVMTERSVREYARRSVELGIATADKAPTTGRGRPGLLYRLTEATAPTWRAVEERGRAALVQARAAAARRKAEARAVYKTLGGTINPDALRVAWAQFREQVGRKVRLVIRGRHDLGRAEWVDGVKQRAAAVIEQRTPPEWVTDPWPLGVSG